jgi:hypothetical protein
MMLVWAGVLVFLWVRNGAAPSCLCADGARLALDVRSWDCHSRHSVPAAALVLARIIRERKDSPPFGLRLRPAHPF